MLVANDDPRAPAVLREAYLLLQRQADKIGNDTWRDSFLHNIPAHQALVEAYRSLSQLPATVRELTSQSNTQGGARRSLTSGGGLDRHA